MSFAFHIEVAIGPGKPDDAAAAIGRPVVGGGLAWSPVVRRVLPRSIRGRINPSGISAGYGVRTCAAWSRDLLAADSLNGSKDDALLQN